MTAHSIKSQEHGHAGDQCNHETTRAHLHLAGAILDCTTCWCESAGPTRGCRLLLLLLTVVRRDGLVGVLGLYRAEVGSRSGLILLLLLLLGSTSSRSNTRARGGAGGGGGGSTTGSGSSRGKVITNRGIGVAVAVVGANLAGFAVIAGAAADGAFWDAAGWRKRPGQLPGGLDRREWYYREVKPGDVCMDGLYSPIGAQLPAGLTPFWRARADLAVRAASRLGGHAVVAGIAVDGIPVPGWEGTSVSQLLAPR
jgi:hypothetical protein